MVWMMAVLRVVWWVEVMVALKADHLDYMRGKKVLKTIASWAVMKDYLCDSDD
jgi:hypothetical protein